MSSKICKRCLIEKELDSFYFEKRTKKHVNICRDCTRKSNIELKVTVNSRVCTKCKEIKDVSFFHKDKHNRFGIKVVCSKCVNDKKRKPPREKVVKTHKKCPDCKIVLDVSCYNKNRARSDGISSVCKKCTIKRSYDWAKKNTDRVRQNARVNSKKDDYKKRKRDYKKRKENEDPLFKFKSRVRSCINMSFRKLGNFKSEKTEDLIGCDLKTLISQIESMFEEGMCFENYGEWHIDHIIPLYFAKTKSDIVLLCNYKNLRPCWAKENIVKGNKFIQDFNYDEIFNDFISKNILGNE